MSVQDLLAEEKRADMVVADLTNNGGLLPPTVAAKFIDELYNATRIFSMASQERMPAPTHKIPRIGFTGQLLMASPGDNTELAAANRVSPTTFQVQLDAKEYVGEFWIPWTVLEDNVEKEALQTKLIAHAAKQAGIDLADAALNGDTTSGVGNNHLALLNVQDGWLKKASAHVVDALSANISEDLMHSWYKGMPAKYIDNGNGSYRMFLQRGVALDWRKVCSTRIGIVGDKSLVEEGIPSFVGTPIEKDAIIPLVAGVTKGLMCDPKNLIVGVHREIGFVPWNWPPARSVRVFVTVRAAFNMYQTDALVRLDNVKPLT